MGVVCDAYTTQRNAAQTPKLAQLAHCVLLLKGFGGEHQSTIHTKENTVKLRRFTDRHPYWFVTVLEIAVILVYLLAGTIAHFAGLSDLGLYGVAQMILTIIAAALLTAMGWWRTVGYRSAYQRSDLLYFIVPILPLVINLIPGVEVASLRYLSTVLAITLMVGFVEESFFRGLMLQPLRATGLWRAAIVTALLFGLTHAMNLLSGKSVAEDAAQIFYATAIGFAYAALALKFGIIWPLVLTHFLIDFAFFMQPPGSTFAPEWNLAIVLGTGMIFVAYGLYVMLRVAEAPFRGAFPREVVG